MEETLRSLLEMLVALDRWTVEFVVASRRPLLTKLLTSVTGLGSATAAVVLLALFRRAGWTDEFDHGAVALVVTGAAVGLLMATVQRPFPPQPVCLTGGGETVATSFPSGHAAAATVFALVARRSSVLPVGVVAPLALLVAVSRVYLGTHYLTDTVAGVALGAAAFLLARILLARTTLGDRLP